MATGAGAHRSVAGAELPVVGCDRVKWIELAVPSSLTPSASVPVAPAVSRDVGSCHVIPGDPPAYLFWRIHQNRPNVLEVVEVFACREPPENGLQLVFQEELSPFGYLCKNQVQSAVGDAYVLYALTVSGIAYLLSIRRPFTYVSGSRYPVNDVIEITVQSSAQVGKITSIVAMDGCVLTGRIDGSVGCYQLGKLDPKVPGFSSELRDDVGIGRLWNLMSRGKVVGPVQDMVVAQMFQKKLLYVLHSDGNLRIWDLVSCVKIYSYNIFSRLATGTAPSRLCVGEANYESGLIYVGVSHGDASELGKEMITVYNFGFSIGDKLVLSPEPAMHSVLLGQGRLLDMKISCANLWVLKEDEPTLYDLLSFDCRTAHTCSYSLQEEFVADQLFQGSEHVLDDVIWTNDSILSLVKDQSAYFISSIYLRRLLQPGVYHGAALRSTVLDHKKYLSDYEFQSLTISGLKKEILTTIESEGAATNPASMVSYWRNFCNRFFHYWCQNNMPYGLFIDSSNEVIGLIRKSSFSLFRPLEGSEKLLYGTCDEFHVAKRSELLFSDVDTDLELLLDVLRCMSCINHHLGRAAPAVFYESVVTPTISTGDVLLQLLKILETGYSPSLSTCLLSQVGIDSAREKKKTAHTSQRKFSVDMFLSLHALLDRASTWAGVIDVIEKCLVYLCPYKTIEQFHSEASCNINSFLLVQATAQIARVMFEATFDIFLLLCYLVVISGQVDMAQADVARVKVEVIPKVQGIIVEWVALHFLGTTPTTQPSIEDFSSRLSSLHIGSRANRNLDENLGSSGFTLACLLDMPRLSDGLDYPISASLPTPSDFIVSVRKFCSFVISGSGDPISSCPAIEVGSVLLRHAQYEAAENFFLMMDAYSSKRNTPIKAQVSDDICCAHFHLLGFCLLVRAHSELNGVLKEQKVCEAARCFFRAASGQGALKSLHNLPFKTGFQYCGESESPAVCRLHYYQWAMQIFEQYGMSEGACQFALAALEQVDDVLGSESGDEDLPEAATTIRGRLWANVFKFSLDLKHYGDAYCAIISNPDEDSKCICLRRFVIVLCELGVVKILCDGKLPFVGLAEKVEQELVWKAERSEVFAKPNLYKVLYAFEASRSNWSKAASYMLRYSVRLQKEVTPDNNRQLSLALQERLHSLSAAINALQLVDHTNAWINSQNGSNFCVDQSSPNKRAHNSFEVSSANVALGSEHTHCNVDIEILEKEFVLASAEYLLVSSNSKISGKKTPETLVDILIQENLYDMAFTVILRFWKGSALKRGLEHAFICISQRCCSCRGASSFVGASPRVSKFLLPSTEDETYVDTKIEPGSVIQWETLELYLEKYGKLHPRLPVTVAETLLHTDPEIELPLWLVHMFKGGRTATSWGMTGREADPAALFRLYVNYGRHAEATNLLLEYFEAFASLRPAEAVNRKRMSAIWFPYTAIEQLWCQLEEMRNAGHMVDQCDKLKKLLHGALVNHLKQVKVDSEDAVASAMQEV